MFDAAPAKFQTGRRRVLKATFIRLLHGFRVDGTLVVSLPDGDAFTVSGQPGPLVRVRITTWQAARNILSDATLAVGEAYMDGTLVCEEGDVFALLDMLITAVRRRGVVSMVTLRERMARLGRRLSQFNPTRRSRRNVAHHYDLDGELYALLLDADRQYSCAYFERGDETLDEAQAAKKEHIARKLLLTRPGLRVLDIGCGWGGMALTLARDHGANVTGITLSREQLEVARARAEAAGLGRQVRFELLDYRAVPLTFDRIVSVGMFEHVGVNHYRQFFAMVNRCLEPDGVALIHSIGRSAGPDATNAWLRKYIFPGGYAPALSEVLPAVEKSRLIATDIEILRLHYARTLACWRENLERHRAQITALYDERFMRMFEFYLAGSEVAFRRSKHMVWQVQLARQQSAVPLTRRYITA